MDGDEVLTTTQMETLLTENGASLETAATAWQNAQRSFDLATDRTRFSTDEGHVGALAEHLPELEAQERATMRAAEVTEINARRVRDQLEHLSMPTLTDAELASAASRTAVVAAQAERAPLALLVPAITRAIAAEDRVGQFLWLTLLSDRVRTAAPASDPDEAAARQRVNKLLGQIKTSLRSTEFDGLRKRANDALLKAVDTRSKASRRKSQAVLDADYRARGFIKIPDAA